MLPVSFVLSILLSARCYMDGDDDRALIFIGIAALLFLLLVFE